jgi:hypothetical protein
MLCVCTKPDLTYQLLASLCLLFAIVCLACAAAEGRDQLLNPLQVRDLARITRC